jgi:hypothetical protein
MQKKVYKWSKVWYNGTINKNKTVRSYMKTEKINLEAYPFKFLIETIVEDYLRWTKRAHQANGWTHSTPQESADKFRAGIEIKEGSKYIKIMTEKSVWGFVNKTNKDFKVGDILKAKSWRAPALNKARGNIFEDYSVAWTGPHYLSGFSAGGTRKVKLLEPRARGYLQGRTV